VVKTPPVPVNAHTPLVASVSASAPVQMKMSMQELCCPEQSNMPETQEAGKPPIPSHLPQPVKPNIEAPKHQARKAQAKQQSEQRQARAAERHESMHNRGANRTAHREDRQARRETLGAMRKMNRSNRSEQREQKRANGKGKVRAAMTARKAAFESAREKVPKGFQGRFKTPALRASGGAHEDEEHAGE
jgi:hypothetical protein